MHSSIINEQTNGTTISLHGAAILRTKMLRWCYAGAARVVSNIMQHYEFLILEPFW